MTAPVSRQRQPSVPAPDPDPATMAEPRFMMPREMVALALIAVTMLLLYYDEWTSALRGATVAGDMYVFAPYVLLLVAVIADMRRLAVITSGLLVVLGGLFALSALVASMVGSQEGSPTMTLAIIIQVPLFVACLRHARATTASLAQPVLRRRMALGLAAGAAVWLLVSFSLAHAG